MADLRQWPRALPCPKLGSAGYQMDGGVVSFTSASGVRRDRRMHDHLPTEYSGQIVVGQILVATALAFAQKVLGSEFEIDLCGPFDLIGQKSTYRATLLEMPVPQRFGAFDWQISFRLRLSQVPLPDFDDLALFAVYGDDATKAINIFDDLANNQMPAAIGDS